jgi:hypothetical protein
VYLSSAKPIAEVPIGTAGFFILMYSPPMGFLNSTYLVPDSSKYLRYFLDSSSLASNSNESLTSLTGFLLDFFLVFSNSA